MVEKKVSFVLTGKEGRLEALWNFTLKALCEGWKREEIEEVKVSVIQQRCDKDFFETLGKYCSKVVV